MRRHGQAVALHHVADAGLVRIDTGEDRGAGGAATRIRVELAEVRTLGGEAIQVGRVDFGTVATEVGVTEIVGEDQDDVRARKSGRTAKVQVTGDKRQEDKGEAHEANGRK